MKFEGGLRLPFFIGKEEETMFKETLRIRDLLRSLDSEPEPHTWYWGDAFWVGYPRCLGSSRMPLVMKSRPYLGGKLWSCWLPIIRSTPQPKVPEEAIAVVFTGEGAGAVLAYLHWLEYVKEVHLPEAYAVLINCPSIFRTNPPDIPEGRVLEVQYGPPHSRQYKGPHLVPSDIYQYISGVGLNPPLELDRLSGA